MAATVSLLNVLLNSGVQGTISLYTGIYVGLASGGSAITGANYSNQQITAFDAAANGVKTASARVNFSPTGAGPGGFPYDEIRLWSAITGVQLHSKVVSPSQFVSNGDTHSILISISGA